MEIYPSSDVALMVALFRLERKLSSCRTSLSVLQTDASLATNSQDLSRLIHTHGLLSKEFGEAAQQMESCNTLLTALGKQLRLANGGSCSESSITGCSRCLLRGA